MAIEQAELSYHPLPSAKARILDLERHKEGYEISIYFAKCSQDRDSRDLKRLFTARAVELRNQLAGVELRGLALIQRDPLPSDKARRNDLVGHLRWYRAGMQEMDPCEEDEFSEREGEILRELDISFPLR